MLFIILRGVESLFGYTIYLRIKYVHLYLLTVYLGLQRHTFQKIQEKTTLMFFHLCIIVDKKQFYLFGFFFKFFYNDFLVFLWFLFLLFKCVHNIVLRDNSPTYKMRAVIFKVAHFQKFVGREKPTTIFIPSMDSFNYFYNFYNYYD